MSSFFFQSVVTSLCTHYHGHFSLLSVHRRKRLQAVADQLQTLNLSTAETQGLSYAISSRGRFRAARTNKIRTVRCPEKKYAALRLKIGTVAKAKKFHQVQGAAFPHLCGRLTTQRPTWDHISNDRGDPSYMHAENLRPASRSEQNLNQTNADNPVEGRPLARRSPGDNFETQDAPLSNFATLCRTNVGIQAISCKLPIIVGRLTTAGSSVGPRVRSKFEGWIHLHPRLRYSRGSCGATRSCPTGPRRPPVPSLDARALHQFPRARPHTQAKSRSTIRCDLNPKKNFSIS